MYRTSSQQFFLFLAAELWLCQLSIMPGRLGKKIRLNHIPWTLQKEITHSLASCFNLLSVHLVGAWNICFLGLGIAQWLLSTILTSNQIGKKCSISAVLSSHSITFLSNFSLSRISVMLPSLQRCFTTYVWDILFRRYRVNIKLYNRLNLLYSYISFNVCP